MKFVTQYVLKLDIFWLLFMKIRLYIRYSFSRQDINVFLNLQN